MDADSQLSLQLIFANVTRGQVFRTKEGTKASRLSAVNQSRQITQRWLTERLVPARGKIEDADQDHKERG